MVRQNQRTVTEVEFSASEQQRLRNGEEVEFRVNGERVVASFEDGNLPSVGDTMYDRKPQQWSDGEVEVTEVTDMLARDVPAVRQCAKNDEYPDDDVVVRAKYVRDDGYSREYSFPASRLREPGLGEIFA